MAASITKEKFSPKKQANFNLKDNLCKDIEDKLDLANLAKISNHNVYTFNYTYAKTTNLTITILLYRSYQASTS